VAFALGVPFSVAFCPACTPALAVLLRASAASGSPLLGITMLASFAGRTVPLALAAASVGCLERLRPLARFRRSFKLAGGGLLMLTGLYLLNAYFLWLPALAG